MKKSFNQIPDSHTWNTITLVKKGWSDDKKYYIETHEGKQLLLRVLEISQYENRKRDYEAIKQLNNIDVLMSRPIDFGICNDGKNVYTIFTWIDGKDAEEILPTLTDKEQYDLGYKAGQALKKMHNIPSLKDQKPWAERFNCKIDRNIKAYKNCEIKVQDADKLINYIDKNRYLLDNRQQSFQHGDYHVGNMIITKQGEIGIIDFNRLDFGDPWEEFNRITWCAYISKLFATGRIDGYFDNCVPDSFFRLLALYIGSNQLSSIPWAIKFGQKEVNTMIKQFQNVLNWYNEFQTYIPSWYIQ